MKPLHIDQSMPCHEARLGESIADLSLTGRTMADDLAWCYVCWNKTGRPELASPRLRDINMPEGFVTVERFLALEKAVHAGEAKIFTTQPCLEGTVNLGAETVAKLDNEPPTANDRYRAHLEGFAANVLGVPLKLADPADTWREQFESECQKVEVLGKEWHQMKEDRDSAVRVAQEQIRELRAELRKALDEKVAAVEAEREAEREACAKAVEATGQGPEADRFDYGYLEPLEAAAAAIRVRGKR